MRLGGGEVLREFREARQALAAPGLASIGRAQAHLTAAGAALRRRRDGERFADIDWEGVRRELSLLEDFTTGAQDFLAVALDGMQSADGAGARATGAHINWSG